jgi:hypothetical protein
MNSGFNPVVLNPEGFKVQRQSQQMPFHFGGSQVPIHMMTGGGMPRVAVPFIQPKRPVMSIRPVRKPPQHLAKMSGGMLNPNTPLTRATRNDIIDMLDETPTLLRLEMEDDKENTAPNNQITIIQEKLDRFEEIDDYITDLLNAGMSEYTGRLILQYLHNYTVNPQRRFTEPNF